MYYDVVEGYCLPKHQAVCLFNPNRKSSFAQDRNIFDDEGRNYAKAKGPHSCPREREILLPHPSSCEKFTLCLNSVSQRFLCPP